MPSSIASLGELNLTNFSSNSNVPESGFCIPYKIFISVDFPAPFSPTIAWMEAEATSIETSLLANTPGKDLLIFLMLIFIYIKKSWGHY